MSNAVVLQGDSSLILKDLPDNSVDSVVTDPPYGLSFMGKKWDYDVPSVQLWTEVFRVLKPGGHLLSFGGTRTYHRMVVAIEDAGFEIRDQIQWIYGSGFPKSLDVSKAIDKAAGISIPLGDGRFITSDVGGHSNGGSAHRSDHPDYKAREPATDAAKEWQGWGTALKPANEPIVLARKPLSESTVAKNVLKWGTGALNIDGSRIEGEPTHGSGKSQSSNPSTGYGDMGEKRVGVPNIINTQGRWPANVLFDEEAAVALDEQSGSLSRQGSPKKKNTGDSAAFGGGAPTTYFGDSGGASRFFYVAKTSKRERNAGLEASSTNHHPTVKPIKLMEYLIKLITPPNGTVLDPFCGSGSTGVAAKNLNFDFIGIERESEYVKIAEARIK